MQIVIPMSGQGERYRRAGHTAIKPLIEVDGRPMIAHVLDMFPGESDFVFICAEPHLEETPLRAVLESLAPQGRIVGIPAHKRGPVHAVLAAAEHISDDEPVILNYCDFSVYWDYADFKARAADWDGGLTAYRGFHPHTLGPTMYAYMREQDGFMREIKEKSSFTDDRMNEYASSGTYYFRSGALMKRLFRQAVDEGLLTNGEYYASMPYNLLAAEGGRIGIYPLEHFLQWGTPEDLAEYQGWSDHFARESAWKPTRPAGRGTHLVPMAGEGARFQAQGYTAPKPLVEVAGVPMIRRSLASWPAMTRRVAVCQAHHLEHAALPPLLGEGTRQVEVLALEGTTEGQASTCLLAKDLAPADEPLLITPCDAAVVYDEAAWEAAAASGADAVIWTFQNHPHANRNPAQYGWVVTDADGRGREVRCKEPPPGELAAAHGVIGAFWFREAGRFFEAAEALIAADRRVNGEFYVDSVLGLMIAQGLDVRVFDVGRLICFGTPDDVKTYAYWERYFKKAPAHPYQELTHAPR